MDLNFAVLIDGDNIPSAYVKEMMEEIAKYGNPTIKRIYGDWTNPRLGKWKNTIGGDNIVEIDEVFEIGRWAHGLDTHGLGGASLGYSPLDRRLLVSNLGSSGQDGVSVNLGRADGWDAHFDPISTGGVMVHAFGDTDTASNVLLGRMACSPGWTNVRPACWGADFTALGAATVTVDVYDDATHTGQFTMPAGAAAMILPMGPGGESIPTSSAFQNFPPRLAPGRCAHQASRWNSAPAEASCHQMEVRSISVPASIS